MKYIEHASTFFLLLCILVFLALIYFDLARTKDAVITFTNQFMYEVEE